jgi:hypothetical protein
MNSNNATCESSCVLEKCGRWLLSIPRDDITVLSQTIEFQEFLSAFEHLGQAHRRVIVNTNRCGSNGNSKSNESHALVNRGSLRDVLLGTDHKKPLQRREQLHVQALPRINDPIKSRTNSNNFLRFTDDVLLRIFEFLRCRSLIQTSYTCSRFYQLARKSAAQRTYDIAHARQLGNNFLLLRAREQIYCVDDRDERGDDTAGTGNNEMIGIDYGDAASNINFHVPVPTLLPGRRVLVENAGDPEYNGVYYCTDANGNVSKHIVPIVAFPHDSNSLTAYASYVSFFSQGFVFTKPRFTSNRASFRVQVQHMALDDDDEINNNPPPNDPLQQMDRDGDIPIVGGHLMNDDDDDNIDNDNQLQLQLQLQRQRQHQHQHQEEHWQRAMIPNNSGRFGGESAQTGAQPLRCIIAKAYSNNVRLSDGVFFRNRCIMYKWKNLHMYISIFIDLANGVL